MLNIVIDEIMFEVWGDRVLWSPQKTDGAFIEAPDDWAKLARALVLCDYEDGSDGHTYIAGSELHEHFIDTHDADGNPVPGGRPSGLMFALKAGMPQVRAKRVMTGRLNEKRIVTVLEWDDPLAAVMTTREAEAEFGLAENSVNKAAQRAQIPARKSGKVWLIRRTDAEKRWR